MTQTRQGTLNHPIVEQSFAIIDQEIGDHDHLPGHYVVVRRVIHSTADFEFKDRLVFSPGVIEGAIAHLQNGIPIIVDVNMVQQGIQSMVAKTFRNPIHVAVNHAAEATPGKTRTETGLLHCLQAHPNSIIVIGNAPTALLATCHAIQQGMAHPALVIGVPVGFVAVLESKAMLAKTDIPQIRVEGRKGGSPVAAAIVNALIDLAWQTQGRPMIEHRASIRE
jgi:precorrin-8X/cobalt-precorrin-8 methylmutase